MFGRWLERLMTHSITSQGSRGECIWMVDGEVMVYMRGSQQKEMRGVLT